MRWVFKMGGTKLAGFLGGAQTQSAVLALADGVTARLCGWAPAVEGWRCFPLAHVGVTDVRADNSTVGAPANRAPRYCTITLRARATPMKEA